MQKYFNITGLCYPEKHYMVDLTERLIKIKKLVDQGEYFVINRARQYGKTTTLACLADKLSKEYMVLFISFEGMGELAYSSESAFCRRVCGLLYDEMEYMKEIEIKEEIKEKFHQISSIDSIEANFWDLSNLICLLCKETEKPVILMIDEVDQTSNQKVFLDFLGILRDGYLKRKRRPVFHSVILAGVYDIKNLKLKMRPEEEHQYNSPWNIAAEFNIEMSFSTEEIEEMLEEYEKECQTGMDRREIAGLLYDYTSGYPYMVSWLCKYMDESLPERKQFSEKRMAWTKEGVLEAVKALLNAPNILMDDIRKKITDYPKLKEMLYAMLFLGKSFPFNPDNLMIELGTMFGFMKNENGKVIIANRIFETRFYNLFLSEELMNNESYTAGDSEKNQFIKNGKLDMELVLRKFIDHFTEVYGDSKESFLEENGRRFFLLYLKPIINGVGNYYIEARTRNQKRTDIIVDYIGKQYVIEMKIWRGEEYNLRGEEQLAEYLEYYHLEKGYLLSFNFNQKKTIGIKEINCNGKTIVEAVV